MHNGQLAIADLNHYLTDHIAPQFDVPGRPVGVFPFGSGNINDTYLAICHTSYSETRFVLQRINTRVFRRPESIMKNFRLVTEHVHRRLEQERATADRIWQLPRMIPTTNGEDLYVDDAGNPWRAMTLIDSTTAFESAQGIDHAWEAGAVLGQFHRLLRDLDPAELEVTLPGFHHTPGYLAAFDKTLDAEQARRLIQDDPTTKELCRFVEERRPLCEVLDTAVARGDLQRRTMHGDPKISNILIDDMTGRGTSIIDLDTVGAGLIQWDYGDAVRSLCNPAGEDAPNLDEVQFDIDLCRAFTTGYMTHSEDFFTEQDRTYLYDSIRVITFELGLRFLQDYLAGNVYFKTQHPGHNLDRAAVQFRLCKHIESQEKQIRNLITDCSSPVENASSTADL